MTHIAVTRLPALAGPAAWNVILGEAPRNGPLTGSTTADVVIVGAGFAGLSAARRLKQLEPDASVMVLDADGIAEGSAGRNSGFMIDLPHELTSEDYAGAGNDTALIRLNRQAIAFAAEAVAEYQINPAYFDRAGKVNGAASASAHAQNESYARHLASLGEPSEMLDAQDMAAMTGSTHYRSGLYTAGTVMLQPAGYVRGLAAGLAGAGVRIHENSAVTSITRVNGTWQVQTAKGQLSAGQVILTVNGHLESFGFAKGRLMQLFLYAVMTPELDAAILQKVGGQPRWGITPSDPMGTTVRRIDGAQGGNRIITRTCATLAPGQRVSPRDVTRAAAVMQQKFETRFPILKGLRMAHAWAGHLCLTRNSVAVTGQLDDGMFSGCVQNGLGTARGTLSGICAAELACGITSDVTRFFTTQAAPLRVPPNAIQRLGGNAVLRYREWRARHD